MSTSMSVWSKLNMNVNLVQGLKRQGSLLQAQEKRDEVKPEQQVDKATKKTTDALKSSKQ